MYKLFIIALLLLQLFSYITPTVTTTTINNNNNIAIQQPVQTITTPANCNGLSYQHSVYKNDNKNDNNVYSISFEQLDKRVNIQYVTVHYIIDNVHNKLPHNKQHSHNQHNSYLWSIDIPHNTDTVIYYFTIGYNNLHIDSSPYEYHPQQGHNAHNNYHLQKHSSKHIHLLDSTSTDTTIQPIYSIVPSNSDGLSYGYAVFESDTANNIYNITFKQFDSTVNISYVIIHYILNDDDNNVGVSASQAVAQGGYYANIVYTQGSTLTYSFTIGYNNGLLVYIKPMCSL